jgi:hypothetical protein
MALFTDGLISSIDDLTAKDSQLLNVASVEGIDVTRKLASAQEELQIELESLLHRLSYLEQPAPRLDHVVATPSLRLWHQYRTLEMVYGDAFNSQLNDRYAGRRDQFRDKAKWAYDKLIQNGVGIAADPVPQASTPQLAAAPGALPDGTYFVTIAWLNRAGEEGVAATPALISTVGSTFSVRAGAAPRSAAGWNVYVGTSPDVLALQNAQALAPGDTWLQPGAVMQTGETPGSGQEPSYWQPVPRLIPRG